VLIPQGSQVKQVYFIESGLIKLTRLELDGKEGMVGLRGPGWILGAASVMVQEPYPVTATALTRCHLRRMSVEAFRHLVKTNGPLSWCLHQIHSREIYDWMAHASGLAKLSARQRLEQFLWELVVAQERFELRKPIRLQVPLLKKEIAQLIAVTPEHLSRELMKLEKEGLIRRDQGWLIILEPQRLRRRDP
jgi:CRP/FNR family transcriptional regulator